MMDYLKQHHLSLAIIVYLLLTSVLGGVKMLGALDTTTFTNPINFDQTVTFDSTIRVGTSGTALDNVIMTTCAPKADNSIAATSTGYAYCTGVTGVTSSDSVLAQFSTSTAAFVKTADSFYVVSAKASSTAGTIDLLVYNGTGAAAVPSAVGRAASTTVIQAGR